jgi:hypothetical protein
MFTRCRSLVLSLWDRVELGVIFEPQTLVLASRADEVSWVCFNSDMILFGV